MSIYSTVEEVIVHTGVTVEDLGLEDTLDEEEEIVTTSQEKLNEIILTYLKQAKSFIDADRNRDYHAEVTAGKRTEVPEGVNNIALRIAANMVAQAQLRRDTGLVKVDEYNLKAVDDKIFTSAIKQDLSRFSFKPKITFLSSYAKED